MYSNVRRNLSHCAPRTRAAPRASAASRRGTGAGTVEQVARIEPPGLAFGKPKGELREIRDLKLPDFGAARLDPSCDQGKARQPLWVTGRRSTHPISPIKQNAQRAQERKNAERKNAVVIRPVDVRYAPVAARKRTSQDFRVGPRSKRSPDFTPFNPGYSLLLCVNSRAIASPEPRRQTSNFPHTRVHTLRKPLLGCGGWLAGALIITPPAIRVAWQRW